MWTLYAINMNTISKNEWKERKLEEKRGKAEGRALRKETSCVMYIYHFPKIIVKCMCYKHILIKNILNNIIFSVENV